jgi:hypothetical protein
MGGAFKRHHAMRTARTMDLLYYPFPEHRSMKKIIKYMENILKVSGVIITP